MGGEAADVTVEHAGSACSLRRTGGFALSEEGSPGDREHGAAQAVEGTVGGRRLGAGLGGQTGHDQNPASPGSCILSGKRTGREAGRYSEPQTGHQRRLIRPEPTESSCLPALAQISPQLAHLPPPVSATLKPRAGSGAVNMCGSPAVLHSLQGQAEPSISVSSWTPGLVLLGRAHGAGVAFTPDIPKTFGTGGVVRAVPGRQWGLRGRSQNEDKRCLEEQRGGSGSLLFAAGPFSARGMFRAHPSDTWAPTSTDRAFP